MRKNWKSQGKHELFVRIGVNTGEVNSLLLSNSYDVIGASVNKASRMESTGLPGFIQVTKETFNKLPKDKYIYEVRPRVYAKGCGIFDTYIILGKKGDAEGYIMRERLRLRDLLEANGR